MPRLLDAEETDRQLADLPGVVRGTAGTLVVAVRAPTFPAGVRLVSLVGEEAETMDHHPDVDLRWRTVTFTLSTHSAGGVTQLDVELAHRILECAREVGADVVPAPERLEVALDTVDAAAIRPFWAAGLGYRESASEQGGVQLVPPDGRGPVLWFQPMGSTADALPRRERGRFHLDVYVDTADVARQRLAACLDSGGHLVSDAHAPSWWVVADVEGNELCLCTRAVGPG